MTLPFTVALVCMLAAPAGAEEPQYVPAAGHKCHAPAHGKGVVAEARKKLEADPKSVPLLIALGDAQAGVWDQRGALATYERAFALGPASALLHQQRGHRYLSVRELAKARADLEKAVEMDP